MIFKHLYYKLKTNILSIKFKKCGKGCSFMGFRRLLGGQKIEIGSYTKLGKDAVLTVWDTPEYSTKSTIITIGDNCNIGEFCHITAINSVKIGNNVLTGRWVTITDNSHGKSTFEDLCLPPSKREVYSKGGVEIGDNVWIGDKVTILPNVHIGNGVIIGANSTVTKSIPDYSIAVGNPAKVIKSFNTTK